MGHYARVTDGVVTNIIVAKVEFFDTYVDDTVGDWIKTSYNTVGGVHYGQDGNPDGGVALRYNFAKIGGSYDAEADAFYEEQPYPSWVLNTDTYLWEAPVAKPSGVASIWIEETRSWDIFES